MQALDFNAGDFGTYLATPQQFDLDLSNASLNDVVECMINYRSILNPKVYKQYSCLKHQLREVQEKYGCTIVPNQITDIFWSHFVAWQINVGKLALSTIKTNCGQLRSTLAWAARHKCNVSPTFDFVKLPGYSHESIALTPDEISHIYHYDIQSLNKRPQYKRTLERIRDMFVLSCNLGCRYSDMIRIDKSCFDRNQFKIIMQKTGGTARVDIDKMAIDPKATYALLEKYDYKAPYSIDNTAYNHGIKRLLKHIGEEFDEDVKIEYKANGIIETKTKKKWEIITSHTCRRSFITINAIRGKSDAEIRKASGHKTCSAMDKYLCWK